MILREVTIGRDKNSDIYLDDRCKYASNHHATIYYDGVQLMYRDTSSNGTMINNVSVKHRAVPIHRGDIIMVAGMYQINWNQIDALCPPNINQQFNSVVSQNVTPPASPIIDTSKWNWGACGLYGLWGFFNGCWWAFLISFFVGFWLFPIPNIVFGIYGTKWAWKNKKWESPQDFLQTQDNWAIWGVIMFFLNLLFFGWWILVYAAYLF